jgi:hypothetical protein
MKIITDKLIKSLEEAVASQWKEIKKGKFWKHVTSDGFDKDLYSSLMAQVYYYSKHNAVNQAISATSFRSAPSNKLLKFVCKHALEEIGHENMIIKDLQSIDIDTAFLQENGQCLPPTQALIGYLYHTAMNLGAFPRLGYSFWAESVYDDIAPILESMRKSLRLNDKNMTFFVAHSNIDEHHFEEVKTAISSYKFSSEEELQILEVAEVTLYLTGQIMESVITDYYNRKTAK